MNSATEINRIEYYSLTDLGLVRSINEDNFIVGDVSTKRWSFYNVQEPIDLAQFGFMMVVTDGVGGENAGEVASKVAVESVRDYFLETELNNLNSDVVIKMYMKKVIFKAHQNILIRAKDNKSFNSMQTTIMIAWILNNKLFISWSGDSRCYMYRSSVGLKLLSEDHSYVWELVKSGILNPEDAAFHPYRNIITQCIGSDDHPPKPDFNSFDIQKGDRIIICTDGLNSMLNDNLIQQIIKISDKPHDVCSNLINAAKSAGGKDNITLVIADMS